MNELTVYYLLNRSVLSSRSSEDKIGDNCVYGSTGRPDAMTLRRFNPSVCLGRRDADRDAVSPTSVSRRPVSR